jgi:hypothetical protein
MPIRKLNSPMPINVQPPEAFEGKTQTPIASTVTPGTGGMVAIGNHQRVVIDRNLMKRRIAEALK